MRHATLKVGASASRPRPSRGRGAPVPSPNALKVLVRHAKLKGRASAPQRSAPLSVARRTHTLRWGRARLSLRALREGGAHRSPPFRALKGLAPSGPSKIFRSRASRARGGARYAGFARIPRAPPACIALRASPAELGLARFARSQGGSVCGLRPHTSRSSRVPHSAGFARVARARPPATSLSLRFDRRISY